mmetsp:Transcript_21305/g.32599  ORF Transcript_21305/g.32599 Transcript_21305/m.32599 type:complete len:197 (+) Transcript_21305:213-803(+)
MRGFQFQGRDPLASSSSSSSLQGSFMQPFGLHGSVAASTGTVATNVAPAPATVGSGMTMATMPPPPPREPSRGSMGSFDTLGELSNKDLASTHAFVRVGGERNEEWSTIGYDSLSSSTMKKPQPESLGSYDGLSLLHSAAALKRLTPSSSTGSGTSITKTDTSTSKQDDKKESAGTTTTAAAAAEKEGEERKEAAV